MGNNCFKTNRVMAQDESDDYSLLKIEANSAKVEAKPPPGSAMAKAKTGGAVKKVVRFKLQEEEEEEEEEEKEEERNSGDGGGVLRIKVVMTQKELKQMLENRENDSCTLEELIAKLKVKGTATTTTIEDENGKWKPDLECIHEGLH